MTAYLIQTKAMLKEKFAIFNTFSYRSAMYDDQNPNFIDPTDSVPTGSNFT